MKKDVLLVDDEEMTNTINQMILKRSNVVGKIQSTNNGKEALAYLEHLLEHKQSMPNIIFLDINMPLMNGFQFLEEINAHPAIDHSLLHIVMLTSSFDPKDRIKATAMGINTFIEKPLAAHHIARYIDENPSNLPS